MKISNAQAGAVNSAKIGGNSTPACALEIFMYPPPVLKMQDEGFHMSAPAPEGASVRAPLPGIVRASYEDQGRNYVRLDHGAFGTSLLSFTGWSSARAQGESVEAGQDLGRVVGADRTLHWKWDGHKA